MEIILNLCVEYSWVDGGFEVGEFFSIGEVIIVLVLVGWRFL